MLKWNHSESDNREVLIQAVLLFESGIGSFTAEAKQCSSFVFHEHEPVPQFSLTFIDLLFFTKLVSAVGLLRRVDVDFNLSDLGAKL